PRCGAGLPRCGRWMVDLRLRRHLRHLRRAPVGPGVLLRPARSLSGRSGTFSPAALPAPGPASSPDAWPGAVHAPCSGPARLGRPLTLVVRGHGPVRLMNCTPREMLTARINRVRRACTDDVDSVRYVGVTIRPPGREPLPRVIMRNALYS